MCLRVDRLTRRCHPLHLAVALAVLCILAPTSAFGQGSLEDYHRAATMRHRVQGKVRNDSLREIWLEGDLLLYRLATDDGGVEFRLADPRQGEQRPAFDHRLVAAEFSRLLGREVDAGRLPIDRVGRQENGLLVLVEQDLRTFLLGDDATVSEVPIEEASAFRLEPTRGRRSRDDGERVEVLFVNRSETTVHVVWLNREGSEQPYATLAPGERHRQGTFAGHLWLIRTEAGVELGRYRAAGGASLVIIDGTTAEEEAPEPERPERGERRQRGNLSPDGRWDVFIRDHNLFVRKVDTGEETPLSTEGTAEDRYSPPFLWSPDSSKLVTLQTIPAEEHTIYMIESSPADQLQPKLHSMDYLKPGDRIDQPRPRLFDVANGQQIPLDESLFDTPWMVTDFAWQEDSSAFSFLYNQRGHQVMRLIEIDAGTGDVRTVIDETAATFIDYSSKQFLRRVPGTDEIIWASERDGWNHLYLIDRATGTVRNQITKGDWLIRSVEQVDMEERQIWFRALGVYPDQDPYHVHWGRVNFDGSGLTWLTDGDGTHVLSSSPSHEYYIDTYSRVDLPPVHELRRTSDGALITELARADAGELMGSGWLPPERVVAKGRDGETDIWGVVFYPSNFDPERSYPVIEYIYAGPHGHFTPKDFRAWHGQREMAELGFIVVQMDGMGTNWRSRAFHDVCWQNIGDSGFPDRIAWIKAAAEERLFMDLSRVGIYGGSAGGQSTVRALLMHGDFYKVGVADCGCHDNRMDKIWWNEAWMGWPIGAHYAEQSNVTQAHRLQGELLLIVGELDRNVDPASTMQVVDALIKADKDFDLIVMTGSGHGAAESPYGKRRRADFFVEHLLHREPRWTEAN